MAVLTYKSLISVTSKLKSSFWRNSLILFYMFFLGILITILSAVFRREHSRLFQSWNICKCLCIHYRQNLILISETSLWSKFYTHGSRASNWLLRVSTYIIELWFTANLKVISKNTFLYKTPLRKYALVKCLYLCAINRLNYRESTAPWYKMVSLSVCWLSACQPLLLFFCGFFRWSLCLSACQSFCLSI